MLLSSSKLPRQQLPYSSTWSMSQAPFKIVSPDFFRDSLDSCHITRPSISCHIISITPLKCTANLAPQLVTERSESERVCAHVRLTIGHMPSKPTCTQEHRQVPRGRGCSGMSGTTHSIENTFCCLHGCSGMSGTFVSPYKMILQRVRVPLYTPKCLVSEASKTNETKVSRA